MSLVETSNALQWQDPSLILTTATPYWSTSDGHQVRKYRSIGFGLYVVVFFDAYCYELCPNKYHEGRARKRLRQKVWIHFVKLMWGRAGGVSACSLWEAEAVRRGILVPDIYEGGLL